MSDQTPAPAEQQPIPEEYNALKPEYIEPIDHTTPEDRFLDPTGLRAKQQKSVATTALNKTVEQNATVVPMPPKDTPSTLPTPPSGY